MLHFWYKEFPQYPRDHKDYWRTRLIAHSLLICCCYFLILTLLNVFYFSSYDIALIDTSGLIASLSICIWFNKTAQVSKAAWVVALMIVSLIMLFIVSAKGHAHSLFWATLIPPFTFFLVGRNWGSILSSIAFGICAYLVYLQQQLSITIGLSALFNFIEVSIAHVLLFRFYEKTRFSAYSHLSKRNAEIKQLAETDKLTGLYNRQKFDFELSQLLSENNNERKSNIVMICDIDHFKKVNDTYGHLAGDNVLSEFANILQNKLTNSALIARWGGEEFTIILRDSSLDNAINEAEELRAFIATHLIDNRALTISIGIAKAHVDDTALHLLERADKALYKAKLQGRDQVCVASDNLTKTRYENTLSKSAAI